MARCCGSTGTCACKVTAGRHIEVVGTGTAQDPFTIGSLTSLNVESSDKFALILTGTGTLDDPWVLTVDYAAAGSIDNLPDVDAAQPTDGYVLTYSVADQAWVPGPPATATPGANLTGTGIEGDGSAGAPLEVTADNARYIEVAANGVGLTDEAINRLVRVFTNATARVSADPPPEVNTLSMLLSEPGRIDYWTGSEWEPIDNGMSLSMIRNEFLELSGPYAGGSVHKWIETITVVTDASGDFDVLPALSIEAFAGVLAVSVQPVGDIPWQATVRVGTDGASVVGRAFRMDDGSAYGGYQLSAIVEAILY